MKFSLNQFILLFFFLISNKGFSQIDAFIESQMTSKNIPGLAACVIKDQAIVWQKAYGIANIETNQAVETTTLFTIASITKLFTTTSVMQLYEDDLLDLDTDINTYLDFEVINPNFPNQTITIRQLLQHRSSLKDPEGEMYDYWEVGDHSSNLRDFLYHIIHPDGNNYKAYYWSNTNVPNQDQRYSNIGFALLGLIVEQVSEIPFHAYCKEHIFEPLCMEKTSFFFDDIDLNNMAMPHRFNNGNFEVLGYYSIALYPSALIKTNIEELANFLLAYTGRGEVAGFRLLQESSVDLLTPMNIEEENLGWWNGQTWTFTFHFPNDDVWYHGGFMPGIRTRINYYPEDATGILILTNGEGQYGEIEEELRRITPNLSATSPATLACQTPATTTLPQEQILIYPTISNGTFYIKNQNIDTIYVIDIKGRAIPFTHEDNFQTIHTNYQGLVFVQIKTKVGIIQTQKLLIH